VDALLEIEGDVRATNCCFFWVSGELVRSRLGVVLFDRCMFDAGYQSRPYVQFTACGVGIHEPENVQPYTNVVIEVVTLEGPTRFSDQSDAGVRPRTPSMSPSPAPGFQAVFWLIITGCVVADAVLVVVFFTLFLHSYRRKVIRQLHIQRAKNSPKDPDEAEPIKLRGRDGNEQFKYRLGPDVLCVWDTNDGFDAPPNPPPPVQPPASPAPAAAPARKQHAKPAESTPDANHPKRHRKHHKHPDHG
jgi:hypothetical protein